MNIELNLAEWIVIGRAVECEELRLRRIEVERQRLKRGRLDKRIAIELASPAPDPDLARTLRLRSKIARIVAELRAEFAQNLELAE